MPDAAPVDPAADRNLLFGVLALQMDFVSRDALIAAMQAWGLAKHRPLGEILLEHGALTAERRHVLDLLTAERLKPPGGEPPRDSAAFAHRPTVRDTPWRLPQPDPQTTVADTGHRSGAAAPPAAGGARFRVVRPHARGGLGVVSVARDTELGREVALKEIRADHADDPTSRGRFVREAEITGGLEHPGVVPVYGLGRHPDGRPYYAMRLIRGESLLQALGQLHAGEPGYTLRGLLGRFVAVCNAVAYAHSRGVLHRDLKPANVMLGPYGETLVVDWGLAKVVGRATVDEVGGGEMTLRPQSGDSSETRAGSALGTPVFMSPEQARGEVDGLGPATDIYGLGATLYMLLTGRPPFQGRDNHDVLEQVRQGKWRPPRRVVRTVPRALDAVCRKAMALEPADRYGTALELAADVEHWLADEPVTAWREPFYVRGARWMRRHRTGVWSAVAASFMALVLGLFGLLWLQHDQALRREEQERRVAGTETVLARVDGLRSRGRYAEARTALEQATDRLGGTGPADLQRRIDEARRELDLLTRLDSIRQESLNSFSRPEAFDAAELDQDYQAAFAGAGLGTPGADADVAAKRVAASPLREVLLAALDDWAQFAPGDRRAWTLEVARRVDPDPWRDRLRDPAVWQDERALAKLAEQVPAGAAGPELAAAVAGRLLSAGEGEKLLRDAQALRPGDFRLNFYLATLLKDKGRFAEAEGFSRAALSLRPDFAPAYFCLAVVLQGQGKAEDARPVYRRAVALDPKLAHALSKPAAALERRGRWEEAAALYRMALDLNPGDGDALTALTAALERRGKWEEAAAFYRKSLELNPNDGDALSALTASLERRGRWEEAVAVCRRSLDLNPENRDALNCMTASLELHGRAPDAEAAFHRAVELRPGDARVRNMFAALLERQGKHNQVMLLYRDALKRNPVDTEARDRLAAFFERRGEWDEAVALYREYLRDNPRDQKAHNQLADLLERQGKVMDAVALYREDLKQDRESLVQSRINSLLERRGEWEELVALNRKELEKDPADSGAREALAKALERLGQDGEAATFFRENFERSPDAANTVKGLAAFLERRGKWEEAAELYRTYFERNPPRINDGHSFARLLERHGRWEEAAAFYRGYLARDHGRNANARYAHRELAKLLERHGREDEAIARYREALELNPKDFVARGRLAKFLERQGKPEEAIALYREQLERNPNDTDARDGLCTRLEQQGNWEEAVALYRGDPTRSSQSNTGLARVLLARGQYVAAMTVARKGPGDGQGVDPYESYERQAVLGGRLVGVLRGDDRPAGAVEMLDFAELCWLQRRYAEAARLSAEAFATDPKLADDLRASYRLKAACHAASAACQPAGGVARPGEAARARLRSQAREWLRADLATCRKLAGSRTHWFEAPQHLELLQISEDLSGVRDPAALAKLPEAERKEWEAFWAEVNALLEKLPRAR